ncbi:MAG: metallophosphoesterase family protein [Pseudomonadota bacterium]|nr:metallophosphoesterase family protein [Pseudomonadota bacterium]
MSTRIGLISDPHATAAPVEEALSLFKAAGVDHIFCAGDIAGYGNELEQTLALLMESGCTAILGNHDLWYIEDAADEDENRTRTFFGNLPSVLESTIEGIKLYMVHASPPRSYMEGIKLLDERGEILPDRKRGWSERLAEFEHDVLVVGHTHQVFAERLANTLVINPGSTKFNHSCAILDLPGLEFQLLPLSDKKVVKTWNWGTDQIAKIDRA